MPFLTEAWHVLLELAPWLWLGTIAAGLLHVLLPEGWIRRRLRGGSGVAQAVALGVPLPLCSCGVVPVGLGLRKDGASRGAAVGFLVSTPQTGVDSILVTSSFLGCPFALLKVLAAAVTGVVAGLVTDAVTETDVPSPDTSSASETPRSRGWSAAFAHGVEVLQSIWLWVTVGVLVSAAISVFVPDGSLAFVGAWGSLGGGLAALVLSLPLYVCATASVPIAAALVGGGLPMGAALVFLMAGPATNLGTIGAIHRQLGARVALVYLGTIVAGSLAFAALVDWLIPPTIVAAHAAHAHTQWWSVASAILLLAAFAVFAILDVRKLVQDRSRTEVDPAAASVRVPVEGMTCHRCTSRLESALRGTEGVDEATVSLEPGEAVVRGSVSESTVRDVVRRTGFSVPEAPTPVH